MKNRKIAKTDFTTLKKLKHTPIRQLQSHKQPPKVYKITLTPFHRKMRSNISKKSKLRSRSEIMSRDNMNIQTSSSFNKHPVSRSRSFKNTRAHNRSYSRAKGVARSFIDEFRRLNGNVQHVESLGRTDEIDQLMDKKFIQRKFKKFIKFLNKLDKLSGASLNEFMGNLTTKSLPKTNPFIGQDLIKNWTLVQNEFDSICQNMREVLMKMRQEEIKVLNLKRKHFEVKESHEIVEKNLKKILSHFTTELKVHPKDKETATVLKKLAKFDDQWIEPCYNSDLLKKIHKLHTRKYKKNWTNLEHLMIRDPIRKRRRKVMDYNREAARKIKHSLIEKY